MTQARHCVTLRWPLAVQLDDGDVGKSVAQWRSDGVGRLGKVKGENPLQRPRVPGQNKFK